MDDSASVTAVVFDMGGVLVELGPLTEILGPNPTMTDDEFWTRWLASPIVRTFELGRCTVEEFGERLVCDLGLSFDGAEMVRRFADWPKGLFAGARELVGDVAKVVDTAVLSNTNSLHWGQQTDAAAMRSLFDRQYLSFRLGLLKPDTEMFEHVVRDLNRPANEILFVDDNQINVDGASACGMRTALARGVDETRRAFVEHGLPL